MKIKLLELSNFAAIYVGLRRERLRLDFSNFTNIITILVGEMGSGKTTILSQLHPWSSIGVLDERNSDQLIRSGKDGTKHIIFVDGNDEFDIVHKYTWTKDHHSTKSFFKFNGEELNPNGNNSSFKELVTKMMGVDQSYLRITRLGPNVSNLIDMPWNQRKSYVASIIESVDIYTTVLSEIRNMIKTCDAELSALTKQIMNVTDDDLAQMRLDAESLGKVIDEQSTDILNMYADIQRIIAANKIITDKYGDDMNGKLVKLYKEVETMTQKRDILNDKIHTSDNGIDIQQILMDIGRYSANIDTLKSNRILLETQANEIATAIDQLEIQKMGAADSSYMNNLIDNYQDIVKKIEYYNETLGDYTPQMTSAEINTIIADIRTLDEAIYVVRTYNRNIVSDLVGNRQNPIGYAKNQIGKLQEKILVLKRQIANMRFVDGYDASYELPKITEKACLECPYYKTHPNVLKNTNSGKLEAKIKLKQDEIDECNANISVYEDYTIVNSKVSQCEKLFYDLKPKVQKLGALRISDMKSILLSTNTWYDYDKIINELALAVNYNDRAILQSKVLDLKNEIEKYKNLNIENIVTQIQDKTNLLADTKLAISDCDKDIDMYNKKMQSADELINDFHSRENLISERDILDKLISEDTETIKELESDIKIFNANNAEYGDLNAKFSSLQYVYNENKSKLEKLNQRIDIIDSGKKQITDLQQKKNIYELIKEASSPQTGIPLLYVQMFLNDCISITNQLISMVLDESVEIMGLDLSKPDMKIPYRKNGEIMEDVKSASQGERAAISLALSFAFMHKCLSMNKGDYSYNILLLDEIDAPFDSSARDKCIQILAQQIKVNNVEQVFFITHNDRYDGYPVNVIATTETANIRKDVPMINLY